MGYNEIWKSALMELKNKFTELKDPSCFDDKLVHKISNKFGVDITGKLNKELCPIYSAYVSNLLETSSQLRGNEIELIKKFKKSLRISDENAASTHVDIGLRIKRLKDETSCRKKASEHFKKLKNLIFVSTQVFGVKRSYLIPWQNLFNLSEAQLCVTNRVVSEELFMNRITTSVKPLLCADKKLFDSLILYANDISLPMDSALAIIKDAIERDVHAVLSKAYESLHWNVVSKHSDLVVPIKRMLKDIARLNILLTSKFTTGSQQIKFTISKKKNNFKIEYNKIFRVFLENCMSNGEYSCFDEEYAHELFFILGIEKEKYIEIMSDVLQKTYRQVLCKNFTSGLLESSKSKAFLLNNLCMSLNFSHEKAKEVNYSIFQTRLKQLVVKKKITKVEEDELETLRLQLCIKEYQARKFKKDILGWLYKQAIH